MILIHILSLTVILGLFFTDGEPWKEHRRFTLSCLKEFGMGKRSLEQKIQEEITFMIDEIETNAKGSFDIHHILRSGVSNIICHLVYGTRFDYKDTVFQVLAMPL